jgi:hypothetical protein
MIKHWRQFFSTFLGGFVLFTTGLTLGAFERLGRHIEDLPLLIPIAALFCAPLAYVGAYIHWRVKEERLERRRMSPDNEKDQ